MLGIKSRESIYLLFDWIEKNYYKFKFHIPNERTEKQVISLKNKKM